MNYKGIVDWLQADDFVLLGFTKRGVVSMMEKHSGREVNDLSSFLMATVLPIAKKKVIWLLKKDGFERTDFLETVKYNALGGEVITAEITAWVVTQDKVDDAVAITYLPKLIAEGKGATGEYAMVNAVENFIVNRNKEKFNEYN